MIAVIIRKIKLSKIKCGWQRFGWFTFFAMYTLAGQSVSWSDSQSVSELVIHSVSSSDSNTGYQSVFQSLSQQVNQTAS